MALIHFHRRTAPLLVKTGTQRMVAMDNLGSKRDYSILPIGCGGLEGLGQTVRRVKRHHRLGGLSSFVYLRRVAELS
jgi:hypothetical protein